MDEAHRRKNCNKPCISQATNNKSNTIGNMHFNCVYFQLFQILENQFKIHFYKIERLLNKLAGNGPIIINVCLRNAILFVTSSWRTIRLQIALHYYFQAHAISSINNNNHCCLINTERKKKTTKLNLAKTQTIIDTRVSLTHKNKLIN